jgi:Flp pilus assembly protein TadG
MVEFAFIAIVLFMFLFGIVEYGRFIMMLQLVNNAAREGARAAIVNQSTMSDIQLQGVVMNYLAEQDVQLQNLSVKAYQIDPATGNNLGSWSSAGFGQALAVQVQGNYKPLLPSFLFMKSGVSVQGTAVMYSEAD